ncbi:MAG: hypothetical protein ACTSU5_14785, partial [Promethearchaeota archaeon]
MTSITFRRLKLDFPGLKPPELSHKVCWIKDANGKAKILHFTSSTGLNNICYVLDPDEMEVENFIPFQDGVVYNYARWNPASNQLGLIGRVDSEISFIEIYSLESQESLHWIERVGEFFHSFEWLSANKFACSLLGSNSFLLGSRGRVVEKIAVNQPGLAMSLPPKPIRFVLDPG